jgi:hypothetical protein
MDIKTAEGICGGLSSPSKMPSFSYNLPASTCPTGKLLRKVEGAVCSKCYACKGRYGFDNVQKALYRRFDSIYHPEWVDAMVTLIGKKCKVPYFRFHDSGDLQSVGHMKNIMDVAYRLPKVKFWLPTLEVKTVREYVGGFREIPNNMNVRLSTPMINSEPTKPMNDLCKMYDGITCSSVCDKGTDFNISSACPATMLKTGSCGSCRKCWNRSQNLVVYIRH